MTPAPLILTIDDDPQMLRILHAFLVASGYRLVECTTAAEGIEQVAVLTPDVIVLDLGLSDIDTIEVTRNIRNQTRAPIVVLSAGSHEEDKIRALDAGADDYLTKPISLGEFGARIRVALRRADMVREPQPSMFCVGGLRVDLIRHEVFAGHAEVHLTPTEYKLLAMLVRYAGHVVTHRQLLAHVWGPTHAGNIEYLRSAMVQLRRKLEKDPARPRYLLNKLGVGYLLKVELTAGSEKVTEEDDPSDRE